jgi:hypothetical protein
MSSPFEMGFSSTTAMDYVKKTCEINSGDSTTSVTSVTSVTATNILNPWHASLKNSR